MVVALCHGPVQKEVSFQDRTHDEVAMYNFIGFSWISYAFVCMESVEEFRTLHKV